MTRRVALVTGASRGIGRACALSLGGRAHRVAVAYAKQEEAADAVVEEIRDTGADAFSVRVDVANRAAVEDAFAAVEARWGPVEILVNNAGITDDSLLLLMHDGQWHEVLRVNLDGAFYTIRRAARWMIRARFGRIVNVGSVVARAGSAGQANYGAAKAGLEGLTRAVARELGPRGVTCNLVVPGAVDTDMTRELGEDRRAALTGLVPLGRFGRPDEVASVVTFLTTDEAAYVTGATIPVDGGLAMGH